jgi:hypothetical protein
MLIQMDADSTSLDGRDALIVQDDVVVFRFNRHTDQLCCMLASQLRACSVHAC